MSNDSKPSDDMDARLIPLAVSLLFSLFESIVATRDTETFNETVPQDGWYNNIGHPDWGAVDGQLVRRSPSKYKDRVYEPSGNKRPNPFTLSSMVLNGTQGLESTRGRTSMLVFFGQQIVEEIVDTQRPGCPREYFNIKVPKQHLYNPEEKDDLRMPFLRSRYDHRTGQSPNNPRQQLNEVTPYLDGGVIYGTSKTWTDSIREFKNGRLKTNAAEMTNQDIRKQFPPPNNIELPFANPPPPRGHRLKPVSRFFRLGNTRGFQNPFLLSFGVLWFRFHNYKADELRKNHQDWNDERLFQEARRLVIAHYQKIVMYDWLPRWLAIYTNGSLFHVPPYYKDVTSECRYGCVYNGYESEIHPGISQEFQTAAMRFGHTLVPSAIWLRGPRQGKDCNWRFNRGTFENSNNKGLIRLCNSFWDDEAIFSTDTMIDDIFRGMTSILSGKEDHIIESDLRESTFGPLEWSRRDIAALNIQRGRDHGLDSYNDVRRYFKLEPLSWSMMLNHGSHGNNAVKWLQSWHRQQEPDNLDLFVGGMLETTDDGPGPLFQSIILDQFLRIRHGDRFWFENTDMYRQFSDETISMIMSTTLRDIILNVTNVKEEDIQSDVFIFRSSIDACGRNTDDNSMHPSPLTLGNCTELKTFDYFRGSEISYIATTIILVLFIPGAVMILMMLGKVNQKKIKKLRSRGTIHRQNDDPTQFKAVEWVGPKSERNVVVKFDRDRKKIHVSSMRKVPLRMLDLRNISKTKVYCRFSMDDGRDLLSVRIPGEIDLILRFATEAGRNKFRSKFLEFLGNLDITYRECRLNAKSIFEYAETKEARKKVLDQFFRVICLQAFDKSPHEMDIGILSADDITKIRTLELTRTEFADAFGLRPNSIFVRNIFLLFDHDKNGFLGFKEFLDMFILLSSDDAEGKVRMMFNMYDLRRTGKLTREQFGMMIESLMDICQTQLADTDLNKMVQNMYMSIGLSESEDIDFDAFHRIFSSKEYESTLKHATMDLNVLGNCQNKWKKRKQSFVRSYSYSNARQNTPSTSSIEIETEESVAPEKGPKNIYTNLQSMIAGYSLYIVWTTLYVLVTIGIFLERAHYYSYEREHVGLRRITGYGVIVTRGAASVIMFTFSTILLTMCRNSIAFLRETCLYRFVPFDEMHSFHQLIAAIGIIFTVVHCTGHLVNFYHIGTQSSDDMNCYFREYYRSTDDLASFQYWTYQTITGLTGVMLTIVVIVMFVFALPYARKYVYRLFGLTHKCYILIYILLFLHGSKQLVQQPLFLNYLIGPAFVFVIDKLVSIRRRKISIMVTSVEHLPSDVTRLKLKRPSCFDYKSGQWVRIACEQLGANEFHSFTLTSAPHENYLSLHIRAVGPWTTNLRQVYDPNTLELRNCSPSPIYVDGPFGDSSQDWYKYPVSILVGGGIGVTPFASILKDIVYRSTTFHRFACKKVYFVWITQTQKHFEWMNDIIRDIENMDVKDFVVTHIFITQFREKFDMRTTMLYICERHFQKVAGVSLFTGLKAVTHFGHPQFVPFLQAIQAEHSQIHKIGIFSCGPSTMLQAVERAVMDINTEEGYPLYSHHFQHF